MSLGSATLGWGNLYLGATTSAKIRAGITVAFRDMGDANDNSISVLGITTTGNITLGGGIYPSVDNLYGIGSSGHTISTIMLGSANQIRSGSTVRFAVIAGGTDQAIQCAGITASGTFALSGASGVVGSSLVPLTDATYVLGNTIKRYSQVFYVNTQFEDDFLGLALDASYWATAGTAPTIANVAGFRVGGWVRLQSSTTLNNTSELYSGGATATPVVTVNFNNANISAVVFRYASDNSTDMTFWMGVSDVGNVLPPTANFVFVTCANAAAAGQPLQYNAAKASTALGLTGFSGGAVCTATQHEVTIYMSSGTVTIYYDGVSQGTIPAANTPIVDMQIFAAVKTTTAGGATHSLYINSIKLYQYR